MKLMKTLTIKSSWEIHSSWTELLVGTRFLIDLLPDSDLNEIVKSSLLRLIVVSASQMAEVMFFDQARLCFIEQHTISYDLNINARISFYDAQRKWPEILTGKPFPMNQESFQSLKLLSNNMRNQAIHSSAKSPDITFGESILYTALKSSEAIYM